MRKFIIYIMTFVSICSLVLTGCASKETVIKESTRLRYKDTQSKLVKYMDNYVSKNQFRGTILVSKGDDVLLDRGYGMADDDKHIKNNSQTVFEIGGMTTQFTATAILMLQEKKLLNVQDKLSKYIKDYPNGNKIKIYNLLTNTSGIDDYGKYISGPIKKAYTPAELIELVKNKPFDFNPGITYESSHSNYILLGYIIEKVSGMKYEDYIKNNIIKPLKLKNTGTLSNQTAIKNKATGYYLKLDTKSNEYKYEKAYKMSKIDWSILYSAGEIYSTAEDLYRFDKALNEGKLINKQALNEMFTPYMSNYGYGWFVSKINDNDKTVYNAGSVPGYNSYTLINPNKKCVVIILSNDQTSIKRNQSIIQSLSRIVQAENY